MKPGTKMLQIILKAKLLITLPLACIPWRAFGEDAQLLLTLLNITQESCITYCSAEEAGWLGMV